MTDSVSNPLGKRLLASGSAGYRRQTVVGLALATGVIGAWLALHVVAVFLLPLTGPWLLFGPAIVAVQCWLSVGLFIVAHDAMHGSLAPFRPRLNRWVGRVALLLYAGLWYDDLVARHFAHHRAPGTERDPDFSGDGAGAAWRWFVAFFLEYASSGQLVRLAGVAAAYLFLFRASPDRLLAFWALPALLSAVQLFYFGTYLPHRREETEFRDHHRARSNDLSYAASLLTCFHFGYHHEHHADPTLPWWRLPAGRRARATSA